MEIDYTRPPEVVLTRDLVEACEDQYQLREWLHDLSVLDDEVAAHVEVRTLSGEMPRSALAKLSFIRVAKTWVKRRLIRLDGLSDDRLTNQRTEITRLLAVEANLKRQLAELKDSTRLLTLVVHAAGDYVVVNERHALALPDLVLSRSEDLESGDVTFSTEVSNGC